MDLSFSKVQAAAIGVTLIFLVAVIYLLYPQTSLSDEVDFDQKSVSSEEDALQVKQEMAENIGDIVTILEDMNQSIE